VRIDGVTYKSIANSWFSDVEWKRASQEILVKIEEVTEIEALKTKWAVLSIQEFCLKIRKAEETHPNAVLELSLRRWERSVDLMRADEAKLLLPKITKYYRKLEMHDKAVKFWMASHGCFKYNIQTRYSLMSISAIFADLQQLDLAQEKLAQAIVYNGGHIDDAILNLAERIWSMKNRKRFYSQDRLCNSIY